jgi:hypothetical protein
MADVTLASGAFEDPVLVTGFALGLNMGANERESRFDMVELGTGYRGNFLLRRPAWLGGCSGIGER